MTMEANATQSDETLNAGLFEVSKIYADPDFNCRGYITPLSVVDLARDIAKRGLIEPVIIRPRVETTPEGFDFVLIAGHRRHMAYIVNEAAQIPAIIREHVDEFEARSMNAIENLKRLDLNMLQEARTVEHFRAAGWSRENVSKELGVSSGWVQVRFMILDMPEAIQQAIAAGFYTQTQIRDMNGIKDPEKQMEIAKVLKEAKQRGDSVTVQAKLRKKMKPNQKRARQRPEIYLMMEEIAAVCDGNNIITRALAWTTGSISDLEFYDDFKKYCNTEGFNYSIPDMDGLGDGEIDTP